MKQLNGYLAVHRKTEMHDKSSFPISCLCSIFGARVRIVINI